MTRNCNNCTFSLKQSTNANKLTIQTEAFTKGRSGADMTPTGGFTTDYNTATH
jgi:hypothetical protein